MSTSEREPATDGASSSGYRYWVRDGSAPKAAPQKIDSEEAAKKAAQVGSAWNHAGTFEERDFSKWAKDYVKAAFEAIEFKVEGGSCKVTTASKLKVEASVVVSRGKLKEGYEVEATLKWKGTSEDGSEVGEGKIEVTAEKGDDTEVVVKVDKSSSFASKCRDAIKNQKSEVEAVIDRLAEELKRK
uniref:Activator of Hsp90 ATPase AHSA1-like N-terminal domain-containing protein n=1 Tax=Palpitomonas bilix TaxID=652834 RepID=A0A7S3G6I9_9EUKA|mmetsp:Transcript_29925/g.77262  ORF Transcript_29925/g.77262 Transcript_29925/m.77262 type:complete len:186 (+) Transcript_29925:89-646(+)